MDGGSGGRGPGARWGAAAALAVALLWPPATPSKAAQGRPPTAVRGVLDLSRWDFSRDGPVRLDGQWAFYWQSLLEPTSLSTGGGPAPAHVRVPGSWRGQLVDGRPLPGEGYGTYRLTVRLPPNTGPLGLYVPYVRTAYRLWADGQPVAANGRVGTDRASSAPQYVPVVARFQPVGQTLELVVQVANFAHREGGLWRRLLLGLPEQVEAAAELRRERDLLLVGSILIMGLYHLGLWGLRRQEQAPLYLGLFSLVLVARILVTGDGLVLTRRVSAFPWELQLKLEYLGLYLGVPLFLRYLGCLFPDEVSRRAQAAAGLAGGLFSAVVLVTPVRLFSRSYPAYALIAAVTIVYMGWALVQAVRRRRDSARLFLAGTVILGLAAINDLLFYANVVRTADLAPVGMLLFVGTQATVLAQRATLAFARQEALGEENARLAATIRHQLEELRSSRRLVASAEDAQRRRIAELLHGRVQTRLLVAWHRLTECRALMGQDPERARAVLDQVADELDEVREQDVREISHQLHPSVVQVGLEPAVRSLLRRFQKSLAVRLEVAPEVARLDDPGVGGIAEPVRYAVYRVLEEALANSWRHGRARHVEVRVWLQGSRLCVQVADDGQGVDTSRVAAGLGLRLIADRVGLLGGTWQLTGQPGQGCCLTFELPLDVGEALAAPGSSAHPKGDRGDVA